MAKKQKRKKSLSSAIHSSFGILVFVVVFTLATSALVLMAGTNIRNADDSLYTTAQVSAERIEWAVKSYQNSIVTLGFSSVLSSSTSTQKEKQTILEQHAEQFGFTRCQVLDADGYGLTDGIYRGNRAYFQASMAGDVYISDPIVSRSDGTKTLVVSAPLRSKNVYDTEVTGVVWGSVPPDTMNRLVSSSQISAHSVTTILSSSGTLIATSDDSSELQNFKSILTSGPASTRAKLENLENRIVSGGTGHALLNISGKYHLYAWAPIANTPGWVLVLQAPLRDFMSTFWLLGAIAIIISIITFFATRIIAVKLSNKSTKPIHVLADQLNRAALGDLNFDIEEIGETDDVQLIAEASKNLVLRLTNAIGYVSSYKSNTNLSDIIDASVIRQITSFYEQGIFRGCHLIIIDTKGKVLTGERWISEKNSFIGQTEFEMADGSAPRTSSLIIDGRVYGSVGYHIEEGSPITPERADGICDMVAHVLTLICQSAYNRNIQVMTRIKSLQDNIQNLVEMETSTSVYLEQLSYNLQEMRQNRDIVRRIQLFKETEALADSTLVSIKRAMDYSTYNDLNTNIEEVPYSPSQLAQQITLDAEDTGIARKATITINLSDSLPSILYGDMANISRAIIRIVSDISAQDKHSFVSVSIDAVRHSYATDLEITISNPSHMLSSSQIARCNAYWNGDIMALGTQTDMSNASLRFISIVRLIRLINGSLKLTTSIQQGTAYIFTLPQVALDKEGK